MSLGPWLPSPNSHLKYSDIREQYGEFIYSVRQLFNNHYCQLAGYSWQLGAESHGAVRDAGSNPGSGTYQLGGLEEAIYRLNLGSSHL